MVSLLFFSQFFFYTWNLFLERWSCPFWVHNCSFVFFQGFLGKKTHQHYDSMAKFGAAWICLMFESKNLPTYPWNIPQTQNQEAWGMLQGYVGVLLDWSCNSEGRPCEWPFCDTSSERGTFLWLKIPLCGTYILASSRTYPKNPWKTNWVCFFYACNCNSQNNKPFKAWGPEVLPIDIFVVGGWKDGKGVVIEGQFVGSKMREAEWFRLSFSASFTLKYLSRKHLTEIFIPKDHAKKSPNLRVLDIILGGVFKHVYFHPGAIETRCWQIFVSQINGWINLVQPPLPPKNNILPYMPSKSKSTILWMCFPKRLGRVDFCQPFQGPMVDDSAFFLSTWLPVYFCLVMQWTMQYPLPETNISIHIPPWEKENHHLQKCLDR